MQDSTAFKFVDRYLAQTIEWVVRLAEILALTALFLFVALRTQSWLVWGFVILLHISISAHLLLGIHALIKRAAPNEARLAEAGENEAVGIGGREKMISLVLAGAIGFVFGAATDWVVVQITLANAP